MIPQAESLEAAYTDAHVVAVQRCQRIWQLLFDLPAPDSDVAINWGHVGDLQEINRQLKDVLAFLEQSRT